MTKTRGLASFSTNRFFELFARNSRFLLIFALVLSILASTVYTYTRVGAPETAYAATSSNLNYQARLLHINGNVVPDGYYNIEFNLYAADTGGSPLWGEEYYDANGATAGQDNRVRVVNGYLSVNLGSQTAFPTTIDWDQELWLTMNVGGSAQDDTPAYDGEMAPRIKLTAVPYAFKAGQLAKRTGANTSTLDFDTQTGARTILLPDESGTLCIQSSANCGFVGTGDFDLQGAYDGGNTILTTDASDIDITLANTTTDANFTVDIATGSTGELKVQSNGTDVFQIGAAGQLQLDVQGSSGGILLGGDASLYRYSSDVLGTNSSFLLNEESLIVVADTTSDEAIYVGVSGEANDRFVLQADGTLKWGDGTNAPDVNLYRSGANTLTTDDSLVVQGTLSVVGAFTGVIASISESTGLQVKSTGGDAWTNLGTTGSGIPILSLYNSSGTKVGGVSDTGAALFQNSTDSTTAFQIQDQDDNPLFVADTTNMSINIQNGNDAQVASGGYLVLGSTSGENLAIDNNEIQARNNGANSTLTLNDQGGVVRIGSTNAAQLQVNNSHFTINTGGVATFRNGSNSTTAFQIQNSSSTPLFTADTTNSRLYVGNTSADSTGSLLVLDTKNTSGDPTGVNGGMYYNSDSSKFRCYQNSGWTDCIGAGGGSSMWQQDGTSSNLLEPASGSHTGILFSNDTNLYRSSANVLRTDDSFIVQPASNNTTAFLVQNNGGTNNVLQVDTTNSRVAIGVGTTAPAQRLTVNAGANYGWNDYIGLTDGTRTGYMGLANSAGTLGFRTGETGNTAYDYIFFGSDGSSQIMTLDGNYGLEINANNNDLLILNTTYSAAPSAQNYFQLSFNNDEAMEIGAEAYDDGGDGGYKFYIWGDDADMFLFQLNPDLGATINTYDTSDEGLSVMRESGVQFMDLQAESHDLGSGNLEFGSLEIGDGFDASEVVFTEYGDEEWAIRMTGNGPLGSDSIYFWNIDLDTFSLGFNGDGNATFLSADDPDAFAIQNAGGEEIFTADTSNDRIYVGHKTADGTGTLLVMDTKNSASDPTGVNGGMYYNSATGSFRCYQGSAWQSCGPQVRTLTSDSAARTSTSFANVSGLTFSVAANTNYRIECDVLLSSSSTTNGWDLAFNGPASPTKIIGEWGSYDGGVFSWQIGMFRSYDVDFGATSGVDAANTDVINEIEATFMNGANAGTLALRYASEGSGGASVTVKAGSTCSLTQL